MPLPDFSVYALMFVGVFAHYSLGRRLGARHFFSACLLGLSATALPVAILANVFAGLIRPLVVTSILFWGACSLRHLFRERAAVARLWKVYAVLCIAGAMLFSFNNPARVFLQRQEPGRLVLIYQAHYGYYASQSVEMLHADYPGRLRVPDLYPKHWARYHFFGAAAQALTQGLVRKPGLFTFFAAQTLLMILILLGAAETFLLRSPLTLRSLLGVSTWCLLGALLFSHAIRYHLSSSGALGVLAGVNFLFALYANDFSQALLWSTVMSASAVRLLPVALMAAVAISIWFLRLRTFSEWRTALRSLNYFHRMGLLLLGLYQGLTLCLGYRVSHIAFFSSEVFADAWFLMLFGYRLLGHFVFTLTGRTSFGLYDYAGGEGPFFDRMPRHSLLALLFYLGLATFAGYCIARAWRQKWIAWRGVLGVTLFALIGVVGANFVSRNLGHLHLLFLCYAVATYLLVRELGRLDIGVLLLSLQGLVLVLQYTGVNEIKSPAALFVLDLTLWVLLGIHLAHCKAPLREIRWAGAALVLALFIRVVPGSWLQYPYHLVSVDVTPVLTGAFRYEQQVDEKGMAKFRFPDSLKEDVYAMILGARLPYAKDRGNTFNQIWVEP